MLKKQIVEKHTIYIFYFKIDYVQVKMNNNSSW